MNIKKERGGRRNKRSIINTKQWEEEKQRRGENYKYKER